MTPARDDPALDGLVLDDARVECWLLVAANALPAAAYAAGATSLTEVLVVYLLEPPIVALAMAAKLLLVDAPVTERSSPLLALDRDWLAEPVRVTSWSVRRALGHVGLYAVVIAYTYGVGVLVLLLLVTSGPAASEFEPVSTRWVAVLVAGFAINRLLDVGQFVLGGDGRRTDPDGLRERSGHERNRLQALGVLYALFGVGLLALPWPLVTALGFFAVKTAVDLRFLPRVTPDA